MERKRSVMAKGGGKAGARARPKQRSPEEGERHLRQSVIVGAATDMICGIYFVMLEKPCMRRDWPQRLWRFLRRSTMSGDHVEAGVGN